MWNTQGVDLRNHGLSLLHIGPFRQQVEHHGESRKPVDATPFGIEVDELRGGSGELRNGLEIPVTDDVGNEALLVLDFHCVEGAPVRVDRDEVVVSGL